MLEQHLYEITYNKKGLEIGGPSDIGIGIYMFADIIDNVIFKKNTVWSNDESDEYKYYDNKVGKVIISDAVDISVINNETYDFAVSIHLLEHIANPLKAIKEWLRIVKNDGYIIIVVPEKSLCFDHKRDYSKFSTLLEQYEKNVGEDDLSTLKEILTNHDLNEDKPAGTFLEFTKRCLDNFNNRCMHHYVYSDDLLLEISNYFNCLYIYHETRGINKWFIIKKNN
jgi:SAM-dependent methyltransferase